jgi:hypothetical protein
MFLLIKLAPETKKQEKVGFIFHPYFYVQYRVGSGIRCFFTPSDPGSRIRIRDKKVRDPDP